MALLEMSKVYIIGDGALREPLVKRLGELALFQPVDIEEKEISPYFKKKKSANTPSILFHIKYPFI